VTAVDLDTEKRVAAEAAAELVEDGMMVGLGTGSTVAHLLPALAARGLQGIRCVATSVTTEEQARELGIPVEPFDHLERLDIAIDGADQIAPDRWLVKGGGGAHTREKIVAAAAERFVVIADSSKPVDRIGAPIPLELSAFGLASTLARVGAELGHIEPRADTPPSPDGGLIADYLGEVKDAAWMAERLAAIPGVVDHGLFPAEMVSEVIVGREGKAEPLSPSGLTEIEKLRTLYEDWARGDFSGAELFDPAVESEFFGMGEQLRGSTREELAELIANWLSAWERPFTLDAEEFIQSGDQVLVLVRWIGRGKGSGV
jgi:ribose 5-phosphate isomerase A